MGVTEYGDDVGQAVGAMAGSEETRSSYWKNCWFCGWWRAETVFLYECDLDGDGRN
ncbi:MAG: hypothetical protein ACLS67_22220 [Anaerobutyricum soehngenii]